MRTAWLCLLFVVQSSLSPKAQATSANRLPFTEKDFNSLFPSRNTFYSYAVFIQAVRELSSLEIQVETKGPFLFRITRTDLKTATASVVREDQGWNEAWANEKPYSSYVVRFREFANNANTGLDKRELAAFFAQIAHETRNGNNGQFNDGLMLLSERKAASDYISDNKVYPAVSGKKYYGRGPLQLSYNGNYGFVSECIFGNKGLLLNDPDLLTKNAVAAFKAAICFWMMPQGAKPAAHQVMTGKWIPTALDQKNGRIPGFGMVTNIINGPIECNQGEGQENMLDRIGYYQAFLKKTKAADPNCACSCGSMQPY
jgi:hypothetical protein